MGGSGIRKEKKMAEFFKVFGITVLVFFADGLFFGILSFIEVWDIDDDAFLMPALINGIGFAICAALLISQQIS